MGGRGIFDRIPPDCTPEEFGIKPALPPTMPPRPIAVEAPLTTPPVKPEAPSVPDSPRSGPKFPGVLKVESTTHGETEVDGKRYVWFDLKLQQRVETACLNGMQPLDYDQRRELIEFVYHWKVEGWPQAYSPAAATVGQIERDLGGCVREWLSWKNQAPSRANLTGVSEAPRPIAGPAVEDRRAVAIDRRAVEREIKALEHELDMRGKALEHFDDGGLTKYLADLRQFREDRAKANQPVNLANRLATRCLVGINLSSDELATIERYWDLLAPTLKDAVTAWKERQLEQKVAEFAAEEMPKKVGNFTSLGAAIGVA